MKGMKKLISLGVVLLFLSGCSTTKHLPEEEVLYTGIKSIHYTDPLKKKKSRKKATGVITSIAEAVKVVDEAFTTSKGKPQKGAKEATKEELQAEREAQKADREAFELARTEVDAVLACPPNGSLFGSSSLRTPLPFGLWFYNGLVGKKGVVKKWFFKTFSTNPILISSVNPQTRAKVATNTLHNYGYFHGTVGAEVLPSRNPRKAKVAYSVKTNALYRLDSIAYLHFPKRADSLLSASKKSSLLHKGDAFSVLNLSDEQKRIETLFRNNGFYYYSSAYTTYRADTTMIPCKVQLQVLPIANLPDQVKRQWYIGKTYITIQKEPNELLTDSIETRYVKYSFSGKKIPLQRGVWWRNLHLRHGNLYRQEDQKLTIEKLTSLNLFSQIDLNYVPRDTSALCDTLDVYINSILDKRYDGDFETNVTQKSNDLLGPGLSFGLTRRNAFRGGEKINFKVYGSYEWQTKNKDHNSMLNSYEVGTALSFDFPRFVLPGFSRRLFRFPASTTFSLESNWINRASFFNMVSFGLGWTYKWNKNSTSKNEFTPFGLTFDRLLSSTSEFQEIMNNNPALYISMRDQFVPSMHYTYTFSSPKRRRNPIWWQTSIKEAGNLTAALYSLSGKKFSEKNKTMFHNPFAQFLKITTELHTTFKISNEIRLATRLMGGLIYSYGNSNVAPYNEQFYVGGANSVRGFTIRNIGPGRFHTDQSKYSYMDQTGDLKLEANAELRFPIFGSLRGAVFVDAGNVWLLRKDEQRPNGQFKLSTFAESIALSTGAGLRYDLDFLVLRLDLGIALHDPSNTEKSGYYNIPSFTEGMSLHFAIGYPF